MSTLNRKLVKEFPFLKELVPPNAATKVKVQIADPEIMFWSFSSIDPKKVAGAWYFVRNQKIVHKVVQSWQTEDCLLKSLLPKCDLCVLVIKRDDPIEWRVTIFKAPSEGFEKLAQVKLFFVPTTLGRIHSLAVLGNEEARGALEQLGKIEECLLKMPRQNIVQDGVTIRSAYCPDGGHLITYKWDGIKTVSVTLKNGARIIAMDNVSVADIWSLVRRLE